MSKALDTFYLTHPKSTDPTTCPEYLTELAQGRSAYCYAWIRDFISKAYTG